MDGTLSGNGGCNQYSTRYLVKETLIVISPVKTTKMFCTRDGIMVQESRYYSSLGEAYALRIHDRTLILYSIDGKPILTFIQVPAGP